MGSEMCIRDRAVTLAVKESSSIGIVLVFGSFNIVERVGDYLAV